MADYQTIVDSIRAFIAATDRIKTPQVVELAAAYVELCNDANARLRKCISYLRQGLRAEAIHLAEEHPGLLEMVSALDFPELSEWQNLCSMFELPAPVPLLINLAQELNEGYADALPLDQLLDRHRRLALLRAPLVERIAVMRELAAADPGSGFWDEDIRTFETARIKAIKIEAAAAIKSRDRGAIARLLAEINADGWRAEAPAEHRSALERAHLALGQQEILHQIRLIMHDLDVAYGAMDLPAVQTLAAEVRAKLSEAKIAPPAEIAQRLIPAEQWCQAQFARAEHQGKLEAAWSELASAIHAGASDENLNSLKRIALALGEPLPDQLEEQLRSLIAARADAKRRKARQRMMLVGAGAVVVVLIAGVATWMAMRASTGREAERVLSAHYTDGDLHAAQDDLARFARESPYVLDRPEIQRIKSSMEADTRTEQDRQARFAIAFSAAQAAVNKATASADLVDVSWSQASSAIVEANSLAKLREETARVSDLRTQIARAKDDLNGKQTQSQEAAFRKKLSGLQTASKSLAAAAAAGTLMASDNVLTSSISKAADLLTDVPSGAAAEELRKDAQVVLDGLKAIAARCSSRDAERTELAKVKEAATSPASLKTALQQFVSRCPQSDHAPRFTTAMANLGIWQAVDETGKLLDNWNHDLEPHQPSQLATRISAIATYLSTYSESPWAPVLDDYQSYLRAWQRGIDDKGPWKSAFKPRLQEPQMLQLLSIKSAAGDVYYLSADQPDIDHDALGVVFKSVYRRDIKVLKRVHLNEVNFNSKPVPSPQSVLCNQLLEQFDAKLNDDWETFGFEVASKVLQSSEVDPILRVFLIEYAVKSWQAASYGADDELRKLAADIGRLNASDIAWLDTDNADVKAKRSEAAQLLTNQLPALLKARTAMMLRRDQIHKGLALHIVGRGVMLREPSGWQVYTSDKVTPGIEIYTGKVKRPWIKVGQARGGNLVVDIGAVTDDLDGNMVFLVAPT